MSDEHEPKPHQRYERILIWHCGHPVEDPDDSHCLSCGYPVYDDWKSPETGMTPPFVADAEERLAEFRRAVNWEFD